MSILIVFVDGAVGAGKTTLIKKLRDLLKCCSKDINVCVVNEPLERECTRDIVTHIGYPALIDFIVARKYARLRSMLDLWANAPATKLNVLLVERSIDGDKCVRGYYNPISAERDFNDVINRRYVTTSYILVKRDSIDTEESKRLHEHYRNKGRIIRNEKKDYDLWMGAVNFIRDIW